jgi:hypothetical protein
VISVRKSPARAHIQAVESPGLHFKVVSLPQQREPEVIDALNVVHELLDLLASNGGTSNKPLASVVLRILPFFSMAYREQREVRCVGD